MVMDAGIDRPATRDDRIVSNWLFACCAAVLAMVVIGGITRLTESGLSITEWQPLVGALPPLSEAEWQRLFGLYQQTSEYRLENSWMTIADFKTIFWWEYIHRLWGRLIGVVFILPLIFFAWRGMLRRGLGLKLVAVFALGGVQGAIGWWMVKSGLVDRTTVSPYRLTVHLGLALVLFGLMFWIALGLRGERATAGGVPPSLRRLVWIVLGAVGVTVLAGAFVAGNRAGLVYNTFPLMDGRIIPPDYAALPSLLHNTFENPAAVQFHHRVLAVATFLLVGLLWWRTVQAEAPRAVRTAVTSLMAAVTVQAATGITTLILVVPIPLAAVHQGGAVVVLACALWAAHAMLPRRAAAEAGGREMPTRPRPAHG
ncbi:cytochrome c oxidase assembly protein subunit 15 [Constrictibacter sp. MBR-5]|uniref:COX15/CtaA family protein n=1 Tax=Constrictibacter sp. MBR-5 TaxID=3156467 RepID=UPI00339B97D0